MSTDEQRTAAYDLMMSPTFQALVAMASICPLDMSDNDNVKGALATSGHQVIRALDAGGIHFDQDEDRAALHGLLMAVLEILTDGSFGHGFIRQAVH